jgi:APA family basic amino acid/polyamine antiporter
MVGYAVLGKSGSPLATAMSTEGLSFGTQLVAAGALLATGTVVLASILGISRLAQAMAVNRELPAFLGKVDKRTAAPANAIILGGIAMLLVAFFADLPHIAYISSFSLLVYYAAMNLGGLRIFNGTMRVVAGIALLSCVGLMLSLPVLSWAVGIAAILLGLVYYFLVVKRN